MKKNSILVKFSYLILFLTLTACTFKSFVISNASYIVANRVGNKIDLSWDQEKEFRKQLDYLFKTEINGIDKISKVLKNIDPKSIKLEEIVVKLFPVYEKFYLEITPLVAGHMNVFSKKQQRNFFEIAEDENQTVINRSKKDKSGEYIKRFEFIFGSINKKQKDLFKKYILFFQNLNKDRIKRRLMAQKDLRKAFVISDEVLRLKEIEKILLSNLDKSRLLKNAKIFQPLFSKLQETLEEGQVKHFEEKKKEAIDWINSFVSYYKK